MLEHTNRRPNNLEIRGSGLVLGRFGSGEELDNIGSTLCLFSSRERDDFECALVSQTSYGDAITKLLMDLKDVSSKQGLDAVQTVVNDSLIMSNPIKDISVLNHDIFKLVDWFLQLIDLFIKSEDMVKERGRRGDLRRV